MGEMRTRLATIGRRVRTVLDLLATVSVIIAAIAVSVAAIGMYTGRNRALAGAIPEGPPPPADPQPLRGAELLGSNEATVAVIEYSDFQCPFCGEFARNTWPALKDAYVKTGKVAFAFRHMPLPMHANAMRAAQAAHCAGAQGKFWELHDKLFEPRVALDERGLMTLAGTLGFDQAAFNRCLQQPTDAIARDLATARRLGISATPTFLIGRLKQDGNVLVDRVLPGALPLETFKAVLDELLDRPPLRAAQ